ncbi:Ankyrin repeat-containing protein [Fagus crenata]
MTHLPCARDQTVFFLSVLKCVRRDAKNLKGSKDTPGAAGFNATNGARHKVFPSNYGICFEFVKLASKSILVIFGLGSSGIRKIEEKKQKHTWAVQILNELLQYSSLYEYDSTGANPLPATPQDDVGTIPYDVSDGGDINFASEASFLGDLKPKTLTVDIKVRVLSHIDQVFWGSKKKKPKKAKKESPILIAAKNGITEIVKEILELFPVAIHDMNEHKKNIVLLAVENRQPHVYQLLLRRNVLRESVFRRVDHKGNSALHLSAKLGDHKPWLIPGAALQIQWEIKWNEFVKDSMPFHFFPHNNKDGKTSREIFTETDSDLVKEGSQWLISTSNSYSVVAALIAAVAFASSTTVPGGIKEESGTPTLENQPAFDIFAIASLIALCFSVTALVMFPSILTSRYQERDFGMDLPRKLLLGLTSLFVSIASMLISSCAGHFFVLKDKLKYAAFPVYAVTCLPITFFAIAQFPLYFDLLWAIFKKVPQRSYKVATF